MSDPSKAVFLSYASQDAEAAKRICEALRAAGVEVWFDQNELVGGDAWDQKIREQIASCALFVPVISASTQARLEGYFRREWKQAANRTHDMAEEKSFLLPMVIDDTRDAEAKVPAEFKAVQWTRLRPSGFGAASPMGGEDPALAKFVARVQQLLLSGDKRARSMEQAPGGAALRRDSSEASGPKAPPPGQPTRRWLVPVIGGLGLALVALLSWRTGEKPSAAGPLQPGPATAVSPTTAPVSEVRTLVAKARALIDDDPLVVRESYKSAVDLCERATQLSPDDGEAWATLARANLRLVTEYREDTEKRRIALRSQTERAIRLAPEAIEAGLAMAGYELFVEDNVPAARVRLLRLIERAPTDRRLLRMMVILEEDRGQDVQEARRWTERANALPGGDAGTLLSLAWVHWGRNEYPLVREAVEKSLAIRPMTESCQLQLMLLNQSGDFEGARRYQRELPAAILREDRTALVGYEVQLYSGDYEGALRAITAVPREILEEGRFFSARGYLAGNALLLAGKTNAAKVDFGIALKALEERLAATPRDSRVAYLRAMVLARLGETALAEQQLVTARELGRDDWYEPDACVLLGRIDEALASFERTIVRTQSRWPIRLRYLKYDPLFAPLRRTPRGAELLAQGDSWLRETITGGSKPEGVAPPAPAAGAASAPSPSSGLPPPSQPPVADAKSVAVLAFANLSDDKANEYFSDGISEELLNVLAKVPGLKVTARTSSFHFKGKDTPIPEIAQQLGVAYVVEGSVRKAGDKVRITAQLIKAADGFHVWSDTFTRDLKDIFAVQDEIAGLVANNLSLKLGVNNVSESLDAEVLPLYYAALQAWNLRTVEGMDRAEELLNRALRLAPNFARGHAVMAKVWAIRGELTDTLSPFGMRDGPLARAIRQKVDQALALDPQCAEAYGALGVLNWDTWRSDEAAVALRRATQLNPNYASAHQWLGRVLSNQGYLDEGIASLQRAVEVDPLAQRILDNCGRLLYLADRPREALAMAERALVIQPSAIQAQALKAQALIALGQPDEALRIARNLPSNLAIVTPAKVYVLAATGHRDEVEQLLPQLTGANQLARVGALCALGRLDEAVATLDPNWFSANRADLLLFDHLLDPIRREPAFLRLLDQLGLREAHQRAQAWRAAHPLEKPEAKE